ncbi:MAG TPA: HEAT repeat domain-containing protein [Candidatus Elarobacter sp.]
MNWHGLPHSEFVVPGILFLVFGIILIGISLWPERKPAVVAVEPVESMPIAAPEITGAVTPFHRDVTWPLLIDTDAGELTEPERRALIEGLSLVGNAWTGEILVAAFDQELGPLRVAVIEALAFCEGDAIVPTLERAYSSYSVAERFAAVDAASRRADIDLLERALRDTDGSVALAAAYGLHRARRDDLIDDNIGTRADARANEIRAILPLLHVE